MKKNNTVKWTKKHLLGIEELSGEEILLILDQAVGFKATRQRRTKGCTLRRYARRK